MDVKITGLDEAIKKLDRLAKDASAPEMARRMGDVRCPDHGRTPTNVRVVGNEARAEFCCDKLRKMAMEAVLGPVRQGSR
ncbi:MAG: hypothetical protein ACHQ01_09495 [Candidatus Limnocylindrales bacterium]